MPQNFVEFLRTLFFDRTPPVAASETCKNGYNRKKYKKIGKDE